MSLQMPNAVVAEMHELAAEMGVRLRRAGEQAGQFIKQEVEELPEQDWNCAALEALSLAAGKSDEKAFEARRRLGESLARQHAELEALEVQATNYQRAFETLSAQLDALMSPPPARRTGVKPAIAGLTRTVAEDHRLGRFKG